MRGRSSPAPTVSHDESGPTHADIHRLPGRRSTRWLLSGVCRPVPRIAGAGSAKICSVTGFPPSARPWLRHETTAFTVLSRHQARRFIGLFAVLTAAEGRQPAALPREYRRWRTEEPCSVAKRCNFIEVEQRPHRDDQRCQPQLKSANLLRSDNAFVLFFFAFARPPVGPVPRRG